MFWLLYKIFTKKKILVIISLRYAGVAQGLEHHLAKVGVAGSNPVSRSRLSSLCFQNLKHCNVVI